MWNSQDHEPIGPVDNSEIEALGLERFDFDECGVLPGLDYFALAELLVPDDILSLFAEEIDEITDEMLISRRSLPAFAANATRQELGEWTGR
jgi:hypothetical protein